MKKWITFLLIGAMLLGCSGCQKGQAVSDDLMEGITRGTQPETPGEPEKLETALLDFGTKLLQKTAEEGENSLISPVSVLYALSMTGNGAEGETLAQMEGVLGMPVRELNPCLRDYARQSGEQLKLANGIWFKADPGLHIETAFLQTNRDFYDAAIRQAPFDDKLLKEINGWVEEKTNGMIKDILDRIPEDTVMYLVNALAFEGKWETPYTDALNEEFTNWDGTKTEVSMMFSEEMQYLEDDHATGFVKAYQGNRYAFAAILPEEGMPVQEYVQSLTGEKLRSLMEHATSRKVEAAMPKFETDFSAELRQVLQDLGMARAFDAAQAEFSPMGEWAGSNLYVGQVLHKTHITVDMEGTKAGAATKVEIKCEGAMEPEQVMSVILNRPFVYLIWDSQNHVPVFMGTMEHA